MNTIKYFSAFCFIFIFIGFHGERIYAAGTGIDGDITSSTLTVTGPVSISTLTVTGPLSAQSIVTSSNISVGGSVSVTSSVIVTGLVSISSLTATGSLSSQSVVTSSNVSVGGSVFISSNAMVTGLVSISSLTAMGSLSGQSAAISNNLSVGGSVSVSSNVTVTGLVALSSLTANSISVSTITVISSATIGNLSLGGNIAMGSHKVTGLANGTSSTDAATFGQVQYLTAPSQTVATVNFSTTSNSYQTTNLSASITPSSTASRVKVTVGGTLTAGTSGGSPAALVSLFRGSTNLATGGNAAFFLMEADATHNERSQFALSFIDSPNTTSPTTYSVKIKNNDGALTVIFGSDQVMILEEIR